MKQSELQELRNKTVEGLQSELQDARSELNSLQFDLSVGKVKNVRKIRKLKKKIARILTLINEK